jgi:hypothetical protein
VHAIVRNSTTAPPPGDGAVRWLTEFLAGGQESGEFARTFDPAAVALLVRGLVDTASHHLVDLDSDEAAGYIAELVAFCERAILQPTTSKALT